MRVSAAVVILAALVLAGSAFAGGWFAYRPIHPVTCEVQSSSPESNPLMPDAHSDGPIVVCK
jgi:hypothetical protein